MSAKHTPGPWVFSSNLREGGIARIMPSYRQRFCIATIPTGNDTDAKEADARLIAAAPELLGALKSARQTLDSLRNALHYGKEQSRGNQVCIERLSEIDAVIAKATGEST